MRGKLSHKIKVFYVESVYTRLSRYSKKPLSIIIDSLTIRQNKFFEDASHQIARLQAAPRVWVAAQFDTFDYVSSLRHKIIIPRPHHLVGENAERRWRNREAGNSFMRSEADIIVHARRSISGSDGDVFEPEVQLRLFQRDERKLENLVGMLKLSEREVFSRLPNEFTREFRAFRGLA